MSAARLANDKGETVSLLPPATVYRLSSKSAPVAVITDVISRAEAGEIISDKAVAAAIAEAKYQARQAAAIDKRNLRRSARQRQRQREEVENSRNAFLLRADQARIFANYSGPTDAEILKFALAAAQAWQALVADIQSKLRDEAPHD
jgi:hypothetical protein